MEADKQKKREQVGRELRREADLAIDQARRLIEDGELEKAKWLVKHAARAICRGYHVLSGIEPGLICIASSVEMVKGTLVGLNGCQIEEFLKFLPTMEYLEKEVKATSLKKEDVQTCWDDVLRMLKESWLKLVGHGEDRPDDPDIFNLWET